MGSRTETLKKKKKIAYNYSSPTPLQKESAKDYLISLTGTVPGLIKQHEQ